MKRMQQEINRQRSFDQLACTMAADALAPGITRSLATMVSIIENNQGTLLLTWINFNSSID